jgi:hypothetical protein
MHGTVPSLNHMSSQYGAQTSKRETKFYGVKITLRGLGSVVGIATAYGLDGPGIESRW